MSVASAFAEAARAALAQVADAAKAPGMQAYRKSEMPYRGVAKPERRVLTRELFSRFPLPDRKSFTDAVRTLWRRAEYREERYVALDLTGYRTYARWQDAALLPLSEEMIVTGAWWDYVDEIAIRRIGPILRADWEAVTPIMRAWAGDTDRRRRRTAVICQVGAKADTDTTLLTSTIETTLADPDFFLRKGIGWALREYAKTDPGWVRQFADAHPRLSALSRREALRRIEATSAGS
jgi:3-methyladenine DNA glycosylase AlkD